jgi:hypothetical protein
MQGANYVSFSKNITVLEYPACPSTIVTIPPIDDCFWMTKRGLVENFELMIS